MPGSPGVDLGSASVLNDMRQEIPQDQRKPYKRRKKIKPGRRAISDKEWSRRFDVRFKKSMHDYYFNHDRSSHHASSWWSDVPGAGRYPVPFPGK